MPDVPADIGDLMDIFLDVVPTVVTAIATIIIGYVLAYVAGQAVRSVFSGIGSDRPAGLSGLKPSVIAGKITQALLFAIVAILAIQIMADGGAFLGLDFIKDYGIRFVLGIAIMFCGAFLADLTSSALARWLHGGVCLSTETDPTRDLVFLGLITAVVLMGLGIMLLDSLPVMMIYLAFLAIGVAVILLGSRRRLCRTS